METRPITRQFNIKGVLKMYSPISLLSGQYVLSSLSTSSAQVTLDPNDINTSFVVIDNTMGSTPVFVTSGTSSTTAVFPSSATVGSAGKVVGPGTVQIYTKNPAHQYIAAIRQSGTADLYITVGSGQ